MQWQLLTSSSYRISIGIAEVISITKKEELNISKEQTLTQSHSNTLQLEKDTVVSKVRNLLGPAANAIELITELKNNKISVAVFLDIIELFDENIAKQSIKDVLELTDKIQTAIEDD